MTAPEPENASGDRAGDWNRSLGSRVAELVEPFAAQGPVPAAGAAAACSVALGSALALMTVRHAAGKLAPRTDKRLEEARTHLQDLIARASQALDQDCAAVGDLMNASSESDGGSPDEERAAEVRFQHALRRATEVPLATLGLARDAMDVVEGVVNALSPTVACEVITAAGLLYTGAESTVAIVRQNVRGLEDPAARDDANDRANLAMARVRRSHARICAATDQPD